MFFETRGLAGLPFQILDLAFQFAHHIARRSRFCSAPRRRNSASWRRECSRKCRRLLQKGAAGLRLGLDQFAYATLPDHRRRARAGRLVGEEKLHVLGARLLAVDTIDRARLALDAARDLQLVEIVEAGRCRAI